jgi:hypothetical protein
MLVTVLMSMGENQSIPSQQIFGTTHTRLFKSYMLHYEY